MWPFKKKNLPVVIKAPKTTVLSKKSVKKYITKEEIFEVGKTTLLVRFQDGREFKKIVYGHAYQYTKHGAGSEPEDPLVYSSVNMAQDSLKDSFSYSDNGIHIDDSLNPQKSISGKVLDISIILTEPHTMTIGVTRLIELESLE